MSSSSTLQNKLLGDALLAAVRREICALHDVFVTWFRGEEAVEVLERDLTKRMCPTFSHVAPNGHMVRGRDTLLRYLKDKYGCYQDRVFTIDVYNVQLLWSTADGKRCLACYEEWQSWDDGDTEEERQQFGRLSTCLLEREDSSNGTFQWIHVHETWVEADKPVETVAVATAAAFNSKLADEDTVITGPMPLHEESSPNSGAAARRPLQRTAPAVVPNGCKRRLLVLVSNQTGAGRDATAEHQQRALAILNAVKVVDYDVVDGSHPAQAQRLAQLEGISGLRDQYPQFFAVDTDAENADGSAATAFWGTWERFEASHGAGTLVTDLGVRKTKSVVSIPDDGNPGGKVTTDNGSSSSRNAAHDNILVMEPEEKEQQEKKQKSKRRLSKKEALKKSIEEDIEASERSWAEASQGILVFEEEGSESNDPVSAAKETEDELNASQHLMQMEAPPDVSRFRHVSPKLHKYAKPLQWENALIGISIAGFDIGTSQGPIADSVWLEENGEQWEVLAQPKTSSGQQRRKICLPEQVYPQAHVALEGHGVWLSWDAMDALRTWAVCHQNIAINSREPSEGVSVLESKDAKLWEGRRKHGTTEEGSSVFHYDWTYSTPFNVKTEGGEWVELDESGMRMDLLTDQSVPILFFDEIILFEDDLHDNGQVQFSIKLRVMPTCAYVLARMWIRVDRVLCRLRETRVLIDFFGLQPHIYRDITWRECRWEDMSARGLPDSIKSWNCYSDTGATSAQWHELIQKLPEVDLPKGYMPHAVLEYGS